MLRLAPRQSVNWINYGGLQFTNPVPLAYGLPPNDPGLFAIQVRSLSYGPLPFAPIAFGAADNLATLALETHPDIQLWRSHRLAGAGLFASYCLLRYESAGYREAMQADLSAQYVSRVDVKLPAAQGGVAAHRTD